MGAEFAQERFTLRFADEELERRYRRAHAEQARPHVRRGTLTSLAGWLAAFVVTLVALPDAAEAVGLIVLAVILPTHFGQWAVATRDSLLPLLEGVTGAGLCAAGASLVVLGDVVLASRLVSVGGALLVIMYAGPIFRLPPLTTALSTAPFVLGATVHAVLAHASGALLSRTDLVASATVLWLGWTYGISAAHAGEVESRHGFVQDLLLGRQTAALAAERARSEALLLNVLPASVAARLRDHTETVADAFDDVSIVFADIVGSTAMSARMPPAELVQLLNRLFSTFDDLAERHGMEKIKIIGDAYMAAGGVPVPRPDHAVAAAAMALDMVAAVTELARSLPYPLTVRVGIHSGPVVAGVIGKRRFIYDLYGDTVNTAARMESHGIPGEIQVSEAVHERLRAVCVLEERGVIDVKGKGEMRTFLLKGRRSA